MLDINNIRNLKMENPSNAHFSASKISHFFCFLSDLEMAGLEPGAGGGEDEFAYRPGPWEVFPCALRLPLLRIPNRNQRIGLTKRPVVSPPSKHIVAPD